MSTTTATASGSSSSNPASSSSPSPAPAPSSSSSSSLHPLQSRWSYYYNPPAKPPAPGEAWTSNVKKINTFDSVEGFWSLYSVLKTPSNFSGKVDYYMFKDGISPEWEDPANADGGKWAITIPRREGAKVDETWLNLLLAMIGEQFDHCEEISGAVVGRRNQEFRFALWLKQGSKAAEVKRIGVQLKQFVEYNGPIQFSFHHDDRKNKHFEANASSYSA